MKQSVPKIRIENLVKIYGEKPREALKLFRNGETRESILRSTGQVLGVADVSLEIAPGELFVVMGLSGSGKSTLVRCLNRLLHPTSGHIYLDDEDIAHVSERRMRQIRLRKVSMVFQRFGLFPHKTVVENVEYGLKVRGLSRPGRRQKALETLEVVGLEQWADRLPASLSGGMQQRVGLARALATDADVLLMDEAFSALDPLIRREMQEELLRLQKTLHKTIVFISHDIQEAIALGDRIAVMKEGSIVQVATPQELILEPADDYIRAFTQEVNRARVLTMGSIAREITPRVLDRDTPETVLTQMVDLHLERTYVVNASGKPVGMLEKVKLQDAVRQGCQQLDGAMQAEFPQVRASTSLENSFHLYQLGLPVAVVGEDGILQGTVEMSDLLAGMGRNH